MRSDKGTYFDSRRFMVSDIAESYIELLNKFRDFKKVYLQAIDARGRFTLTTNFTVNFSSYVLTCYDFLVRGRA